MGGGGKSHWLSYQTLLLVRRKGLLPPPPRPGSTVPRRARRGRGRPHNGSHLTGAGAARLAARGHLGAARPAGVAGGAKAAGGPSGERARRWLPGHQPPGCAPDTGQAWAVSCPCDRRRVPRCQNNRKGSFRTRGQTAGGRSHLYQPQCAPLPRGGDRAS